MKYFTHEWWSSDAPQEEKVEVFERYRRYLASVAEKLPQELVRFESECTLHDAQVKKIFCSFHEKEVIIELLGWNRGFEHQIYYSLKLMGVIEFNQIMPQKEDVESELGDLGYWEIERVNSGIEVHMLFASGAEFTVIFKEFGFSANEIAA
jgi:Protein of unknown function (DUF4085)